MKTYFLIFIVALIAGILMIILGIVYSKKLTPIGVISVILIGSLIAIISVIMCLSLGFFMR